MNMDGESMHLEPRSMGAVQQKCCAVQDSDLRKPTEQGMQSQPPKPTSSPFQEVGGTAEAVAETTLDCTGGPCLNANLSAVELETSLTNSLG